MWLKCILLYLSSIAIRLNAVEIIYGFEDPSKNFVKNWDFENDASSDDWQIISASVQKVDGGYEGGSAYKITQRTGASGGVKQSIEGNLKPNTIYYMSVFTKQLNDVPGNDYAAASLYARMWHSGGGRTTREIAALKYLRKTDVWYQFGGDFTTPNEEISKIEMYMTMEPKEVNFMLDKASLIELSQPDDWKAYFDTKINKHRRSDVYMKVKFADVSKMVNAKIKVRMVRHAFGFGMALKALPFTRNDETNTNYRNFFLDNKFSWAGFENDMKWKPMEPTEGTFKTGKVDASLDILEAHNITVRGHAALWDIDTTNPSWVRSKSGEDLRQAVMDRITRYVEHFKGRIYCYDMCNEYLHQHFLEDEIGDFDMLAEEFQKANEIDPDAKLFLNDYELLRSGKLTSANTNLVRWLRHIGRPIDGIGIQGHLRILPVNSAIMEKRLQISGSVGVPVHITELSVHDSSPAADQLKADGIDMAFRVMFAEPTVEAIIVWGHSCVPGYSMGTDMCLTTGTDMTPNAAGQAMLDLINEEWVTTEEFTPDEPIYVERFRAFHGNYILSVEQNGQVIKESPFYVGKDGTQRMVMVVK